ncbi:MAG: NHL repeat-containing protein [Desulfobacterales bacterium]|nr:MAG: NHL repeat-containing protein [Desulfobacterales bacterium]
MMLYLRKLSYFYFGLSAIILLLAVTPALGIRLINVELLFEITDQLNQPSEVAVSNDGKIYVVDGVNNRIRIFSSRGAPVSSFGAEGAGNGEFKYPLGIDIAGSGRIYVADSGNHRVQIFDRAGGFIAKINLPGTDRHPADPTDIAVDETSKRCYVVDNDNHRILVYDLSNFQLLDSYGTPGTGERNFRYPFLIALDKQKYLYIVDVINTRVQVLNSDGLFVNFIGGWGVEKGEFFRPKGVAVDKNNRIYVSDSYMGVIQVFTELGEFYAAIGEPATGKVKKFKSPVGIFIDRQDRLYVVEMFANKVGVYRQVGEADSN